MLMHWSSLCTLQGVPASILGSLHATPYHGMCVSILQQITKMYDTVQHKTLAAENFGGFPVNRQSFIHQIL